jgi:hypothetical protein
MWAGEVPLGRSGAGRRLLRGAEPSAAGADRHIGSSGAEDAMRTDDREIVRATAEDIGGILDLQDRDLPRRGGAPSARLPRNGWKRRSPTCRS